MEKIYLAVTYGKQAEAGKKEKSSGGLSEKRWKIQYFFRGKCAHSWCEEGQTSYEVLGEAVDAISGKKKWLLRIHLDTGRHHQIRVQMAHAGMPLAGDRKYGAGTNVTSGQAAWLCAPQALPFSIR